MSDRSLPSEPVAVIGAGPVGLAAAAHLVQRASPVQGLEAGSRVAADLAAVLAPLARMPQLVPHLHFGARVVAALAGDLQAADDVQPGLPETCVCAVALAGPDNVSAAAAQATAPAQKRSGAWCA